MEVNLAKAVLLPVMDQMVRMKRVVWEEDRITRLVPSNSASQLKSSQFE